MNQLVLSLFPGIGLFDMAFEREGFCVVRGPDVLWGGDIRAFNPPQGTFSGVIGGPPCQAFSALAHLVRANGHEPRFGNLIPEFERCVAEAAPEWFVMENVPQAPTPAVEGYAVTDCMVNNAWICDGSGYGQEQERKRRFSFGLRGADVAPRLTKWIRTAAFILPDPERTVTALGPDHLTKLANTTAQFRTRKQTVTAMHDHPDNVTAWSRTRKRAVLGKLDDTPVAIGGSGKRKPGARKPRVVAGGGGGEVKKSRYTFAEACRLQGLPVDFLADAPFTAAGKLKAVANGVPLAMGRAIAAAVRCAIEEAGVR
jgi:DNA (cytosine-5)-methyltransferase 1